MHHNSWIPSQKDEQMEQQSLGAKANRSTDIFTGKYSAKANSSTDIFTGKYRAKINSSTDKGSITIRRTAIPSMLVNFSTFAFLWIFHSWSKENIKVVGIGAIFI